MVLSMSLHGTTALAENDTYTPKYSVLYTRSIGDDSDARAFDLAFGESGWIREQFKNCTSTNSANHVRWYNFCDGANSSMVQAADDSDILYVSGHGLPYALLPIYFYPNNEYPLNGFDDSISPDTACANASPNEVGFAWTTGVGVNESAWDTDLEWVVFAACSQLDVYPRNTYRDNSNAKCWARTLLGSPNRAHAIMGYAGTAPGFTDTAIAWEFAKCAFTEQRSVLDSWRTANSRKDSSVNWAYVAHYANRSDRLHRVGAGPTADTAANSTYRIDYLSKQEGSWKCILSSYQPEVIGQSKSVGVGLFAWLSSMIGERFAFASDTPLPDKVRKGDVQFRTGSALIGRKRTLPQKTARLSGGNLRSFMTGSERQSLETTDGLRAIRSERYGLNGFESCSSMPNGVQEYCSERGLGLTPLDFDESGAVKRARAYLEERGELPADAVLAQVNKVVTTRFDFESDAPEVFEPVEYEVRFLQQVGDAVIDGNDAGLTVYLDNAGVREVRKKWFEVTETHQAAGEPISHAAALDSALDAAVWSLDLPPDVAVEVMDLVYYPHSSSDGSLHLLPAWRMGFENGGAVHVDAVRNVPIREGRTGRTNG
ncbi:MAG: hypothetical protein IBX63_08380 [Coriobacteriia bacterium]|nr:hypothetical protein [Coriobacteriia bacterium]